MSRTSAKATPLPSPTSSIAAPAPVSLHRTALKFALAVFLLSELGGAFGAMEYGHVSSLYFIKPGNPFFASAGLGAFLMFLRSARTHNLRLLGTGFGILVEVLLMRWRGGAPTGLLSLSQSIGTGLAAGGLITLAIEFATSKGDERARWLDAMSEMLIVPVFILLSSFFLHFTLLLHPGVVDGQAFAAEAGLGADTGFAFARWVRSSVNFTWTLIIIYVELPLAFAIVYAAEKARGRVDSDVLTSFVSVGLFGYLCYHLCPVIGPRFYFSTWPDSAPVLGSLDLGTTLGAASEFRNCIPSLHSSWAIFLYWHARPQNIVVRVFGWLFFALTLASTIGLGWHYLVDVIIAFPFCLAVRAGLRTGISFREQPRRDAFVFGVAVTALWLLLMRAAPALLLQVRVLSPLLAFVSIAGAWLLELRLARAVEAKATARDGAVRPGEAAEAAKVTPAFTAPTKTPWALLFAFTFSGFAGLVYEVVFAKELALTFGSTSKASTTVLATYMGGLALGSFFGAKLAEKRRNTALRLYAYAEFGIALACVASPFFFRFVRSAYVGIASGSDPSSPWLTLLQLLLGALALLPPTMLMGATMPALAVHLAREKRSLGNSVGLLYGANTLGAAFGAFLAGYYLVPTFHIRGTTWIATVLNFTAGGIALGLHAWSRRTDAVTMAKASETEPETAPVTSEANDAEEAPADPALLRVALWILGLGGVVTLALETVYIHLLAAVAGNSAYAFSLMLFAFLLGLGGGSVLGRAWLARGFTVRTGIIVCQASVAIAVLAGVFLWNGIPGYFAQFYNFPYTATFGPREFVRFSVCLVAMLPVAVAIGASYPLTMEALALGAPSQKLLWMGRGMALNTVGNIVGALAGTFLLLPYLESLRSLHVLALLSLGLALAVYRSAQDRHELSWRVLSPVAIAAALFIAQPRSFDLTAFSTGANVYFHAQPWGIVFDHAESADGGITAVARSKRGSRDVKTLLTNGKFQGDDDPDGEMRAQLGFGLVPLIHTEARKNALVIGFGTGVSTRTVRDANFESIEVAELSGDILRLAHTHFGTTNEHVLDAPNVRAYVTDGRNHLMLANRKYDLVTIELSSIWFAGAASLYNHEFYRLVDERLSAQGILQQWIQLHRLSETDIAYVLGTVRSVFSRAWLYFVGNQGIIIACRHACEPELSALQKVNATPTLATALRFFDGRADRILEARILDTDAIDAYVRAHAPAASSGRPISTDDNLYLEYSTPKGNVRDYRDSIDANVAALRRFQPESPLRSTRISEGAVEVRAPAPLAPDTPDTPDTPDAPDAPDTP